MRIRVHPSFAVYLLCVAVLSSYHACLSILLALVTHESWHYAASRLVGEQIEQLEITPFGGIMTYKQGTASHKGFKGVLVHAAGPIGNYAFLLAAGIPAVQKIVNTSLLRSLMLANVSMLILNLLPALPLDGGHILFCLGYYFFPVSKLALFLSIPGMAAGIAGLSLAIYGLYSRNILNCSLFIVSLYLFISAWQSQKTLICENIYTVVQERLASSPRIKRMEHYHVASDTALFELLPLMKQGIGISFSFFEGESLHDLSEYAFCLSLLKNPSFTIMQAYRSVPRNEKNVYNAENSSFPSCNISISDIQ